MALDSTALASQHLTPAFWSALDPHYIPVAGRMLAIALQHQDEAVLQAALTGGLLQKMDAPETLCEVFTEPRIHAQDAFTQAWLRRWWEAFPAASQESFFHNVLGLMDGEHAAQGRRVLECIAPGYEARMLAWGAEREHGKPFLRVLLKRSCGDLLNPILPAQIEKLPVFPGGSWGSGRFKLGKNPSLLRALAAREAGYGLENPLAVSTTLWQRLGATGRRQAQQELVAIVEALYAGTDYITNPSLAKFYYATGVRAPLEVEQKIIGTWLQPQGALPAHTLPAAWVAAGWGIAPYATPALRTLCQSGMDVNAPVVADGRRLLQLAIESKREELVRFLLTETDADPGLAEAGTKPCTELLALANNSGFGWKDVATLAAARSAQCVMNRTLAVAEAPQP